jgi:hypothetical protein
MTEWEHSILVLRLKEKGFAISRKDVLQGLDEASTASLIEFGRNGWEMIAVMPFSTGGAGMFSYAQGKTDALLAFFKRPKQ